jgi:O-acetylhomoserine/O-acetylserine sulfhydrylase-like pyridoxal-dependent enzyme
MHTLELRMLRKAVNTLTLAECLSRHPQINVNCNAAPGHFNAPLREQCLYLGLPAPLFTFDLEGTSGEGGRLVDRTTFQQFFDCLEPAFGHQVSLGQPNTVVLCPAITSHSELSEQALQAAGIRLTTTRVSVGAEDPRTLLAHLVQAAQSTIDKQAPGFSQQFCSPGEVDEVYRRHYLEVHRRYIEAQPPMEELLQ